MHKIRLVIHANPLDLTALSKSPKYDWKRTQGQTYPSGRTKRNRQVHYCFEDKYKESLVYYRKPHGIPKGLDTY